MHILSLPLLSISFSITLGGAAQANKADAHDRLAVCRQSDVNGADSTAEALLFVRGLLVEGRATAEPQATVKVLRHLAQDPHPASQDSFMAVLQTATLQGVQIFTSILLSDKTCFCHSAIANTADLCDFLLLVHHSTLNFYIVRLSASVSVSSVLMHAHGPCDARCNRCHS